MVLRTGAQLVSANLFSAGETSAVLMPQIYTRSLPMGTFSMYTGIVPSCTANVLPVPTCTALVPHMYCLYHRVPHMYCLYHQAVQLYCESSIFVPALYRMYYKAVHLYRMYLNAVHLRQSHLRSMRFYTTETVTYYMVMTPGLKHP